GWLRVIALDVGQGDATLIRFPDGRTWLVDAGGTLAGSRFDIGARIVAPALRAQGVRRLDALLLTHGDADHVGGAAGLIPLIPPAQVWEGVPVPGLPVLDAVRRAAATAGAEWGAIAVDTDGRWLRVTTCAGSSAVFEAAAPPIRAGFAAGQAKDPPGG